MNVLYSSSSMGKVNLLKIVFICIHCSVRLDISTDICTIINVNLLMFPNAKHPAHICHLITAYVFCLSFPL